MKKKAVAIIVGIAGVVTVIAGIIAHRQNWD